MTNTNHTQPSGETVLVVTAAAMTLTCLFTWVTGQISGRIFGGTWPHVSPAQSPAIAWRLVLNPTNPAAAWPPETFIPQAPAFYLTAGILLLVSCALIALGLHLRPTRGESKDVTRWAKPKDMRSLIVRRPTPGRLTIGYLGHRLIATQHQHSIAVIGPSGSGKTTSIAIPAIAEWDGPVIAASVKNDLVARTIHDREKQGPVWVYDPTRSTGHPPAGWSPLTGCESWPHARRMAAWLTSTRRTGATGLENSDFWYATAEKLLAPLLHAAALEHHGIGHVIRWIDLQDDTEPLRILRTHEATDALQALAASIGREDRTRSGVYTTTETILAAFADPHVHHSTTLTPRITPADVIGGERGTLYICAPLHEQTRLRPLFTALLQTLIAHTYQHAGNHEAQRPLLVVLDEAANIAPIPDLPQIASTARGIGIQLITIWQDLTQIRHRYRDAAGTILNNHHALVALPGISDLPTLDHITRLAGDHTTTRRTTTKTADGTSTSETPTDQPLLNRGAARQLETGHGILLYGNLPPARIHLRRTSR